MLLVKILLFPIWFPLLIIWKVFHGIAKFILSSVALFFKLLFLFVILAIVAMLIFFG